MKLIDGPDKPFDPASVRAHLADLEEARGELVDADEMIGLWRAVLDGLEASEAASAQSGPLSP